MGQVMAGGIEAHAAHLRGIVRAKRMTLEAAAEELRTYWDVTEVGAKDLVSGAYLERQELGIVLAEGVPGE